MTEPKNSFDDYPPATMQEAAQQERIVYGPVRFDTLLAALRLFKRVVIVERPTKN